MIQKPIVFLFVLSLLSVRPNRAETIEEHANGEGWTIQRYQHEFCGDDCWEPFNRTMFGIFDGIMTYAVDPFCYLYSSIVPKPLINGIENAVGNIEYPVRLLANLCTAEWEPAWDETRRFVANSTLGVGGLFDVAEDWFSVYDTDASFSVVFARWGIPRGPSLALPFVPRSDLRGCIGYGADCALNPRFWIDFCFPTQLAIGWWAWTLVPNKAPVWRGTWEDVFKSRNDTYSVYLPVIAARDEMRESLWLYNYQERAYARTHLLEQAALLPTGCAARVDLVRRAEEILPDVRPPVCTEDAKPAGIRGRWRDIPGYAPRTPALDSLRALAFRPSGDNDFWWERRGIFNSDFSGLIDACEVEMGEDVPPARYAFVPPRADDRVTKLERLVFVMPGIGSNRDSFDAVAMAELLHQAGFGVVICDNIFHWEYMRSANRGILPGNLPEDARRFAEFVNRVLADLRADGRMRFPEVSMLGWSMGGLLMSHLAACVENGQPLDCSVAHYIAINPPVDMEHALGPFEAAYEESRGWTRDYARRMFTEIAGSLFVWTSRDHPRYDPSNPPCDAAGEPWDYAPNLTATQARYLLGASVGVFLPELIAERHRQQPFPWLQSELTWFHRRAFYAEVGTLSLKEYMTRYLPTCYRTCTPDSICRASELRTLEPELKKAKRLVMIHTRNDPLLTAEDRDYLDQTLGDRMTWFAEGAHCGMFYTKPFADELLSRLNEAP